MKWGGSNDAGQKIKDELNSVIPRYIFFMGKTKNIGVKVETKEGNAPGERVRPKRHDSV